MDKKRPAGLLLLVLIIFNLTTVSLIYGQIDNYIKTQGTELLHITEVKELIEEDQPITIGWKICTLIFSIKEQELKYSFTFIYEGITEGKSITITCSSDKLGYKRNFTIPLNKKKQALFHPFIVEDIIIPKFLITVVDNFGRIKVEKLSNSILK